MDDRDDTERARYSFVRHEILAQEAGMAVTDATSPAPSRLDHCTRFALGNSSRIALFLDMDGTLLDLAATPESVIIPGGLVDLLRRLANGLGGALAIVTGRRISEVDQILAPLRLAASGVHGSEMRVLASSPIKHMTADLSDDIVQSLRELAGRAPGAFAEPKGSGLAIHYRRVPEAESAIAADLQQFHARNPGKFDIWPGRKVFEVIPKGYSKGTAISTLAAEAPFRGRVPIMIGDDVGDEPAFSAAERLHGFGLRVGGENFDASRSDFEDPQSVLQWLDVLSRRTADGHSI
jgi:trehalose 6-phosphate phosphatase